MEAKLDIALEPQQDRPPLLDRQMASAGRYGASSAHILRMIEDTGMVGFWSSPLDMPNLSCSPGLARLFGLDVGETLHLQDLLHLIHPEDLPANVDFLDSLQLQHRVQRQFRIIRPDRTQRFVRSYAEVIFDAANRPIRGVGIMIDVTDRADAMRAARMTSDRVSQLLKAFSAIEWQLDAEGQPRRVIGWENLTGQVLDDRAGYDWFGMVHEQDRERVRNSWSAALRDRTAISEDFKLQLANGVFANVAMRLIPTIGEDRSSIVGWEGGIIDKDRLNGRQLSARPPAGFFRLRPTDIRAARAALDWSLPDLAKASGVSISTLRRLEGEEHVSVRNDAVRSIRRAFEAHGLTFGQTTEGAVFIRLPASLVIGTQVSTRAGSLGGGEV